jgi:tricorn protease
MRLLTSIALSLACYAVQAATPDNLGYYMQPSLRGDTIVFVSQDQLWKVSANGGEAQPLTSRGAPASTPVISPDGKSIAFAGSYEGTTEAYVMPIDGGEPKQLTYGGMNGTTGWKSNDQVFIMTSRFSTLPNPMLATVQVSTGKLEVEPLAEASEGAYDPEHKTLIFTRLAFQGSNTKRYVGGTAQNIWRYDDGAEEAKPLTSDYVGTSKDPMLWNGRVYFLSDRGEGTMNIWSMDEHGGDVKQLTHHAGWDIQSASMDKGRIAYQLGADIHIYNAADGTDHKVPITLAGDFDQMMEHYVPNPSSWISALNLSPDGSKVAITARGQLFVVPAEPGRIVDAARKPGVRFRDGRITPDGKSVVALSDETGETEWWKFPANGLGAGEQITSGSNVLGLEGAISPDSKNLVYVDKAANLWMVDLSTKKKTKIYASPEAVPNSFDWSPDSQWIAFVAPTATFDRIALYSLKSGQMTMVTTDRSDAEDPNWTPDGKWLFFDSNRTFNTVVNSPWGNRQPEPYFPNETKVYFLALQKGSRSPFLPDDETYTPPAPEKPAKGPVTVNVDLDGLPDRLYEVPLAAGNYGGLATNGDRLFIGSRPPGRPADLIALDIKNKDVQPRTIASGIGGFQLSEDGKKLLISKDGRYFIQDSVAPVASFDKPLDLSGWSLAVEPRREWRQMFTEAWRLHRDFFYDPNMHGVDWKEVYNRYLPLVDRVRDRSELSNLLAQMIGELSTLHSFVFGGDLQSPSRFVGLASLGAYWERAADGYKVTRIYKGDPDYPNEISPLARPEVAVGVGDVIESIDGVPTLSVPDPNELLRQKEGQEILIHVKQTDGKERDCIVRPINFAQFRDLRYSDWEVSRRNIVEKEGDHQIGYVHLRAMGAGDINQWERDFYPDYRRQGLIIDVRHNGGGNIDSWIIEKLLRKAWAYFQPRIGAPGWNMQEAFRGHVVVICDENTGSDGESFTEAIRRLGIGKIIGTRTWGGSVWLSFDNGLVDNGIASLGETGVFGPEGKWLIEGHGVDPDIVVDNLPHATFLGKDAQLEAAIEYMNKEIKDHPVPIPPAPKYPNKSYPYPKTADDGS